MRVLDCGLLNRVTTRGVVCVYTRTGALVDGGCGEEQNPDMHKRTIAALLGMALSAGMLMAQAQEQAPAP